MLFTRLASLLASTSGTWSRTRPCVILLRRFRPLIENTSYCDFKVPTSRQSVRMQSSLASPSDHHGDQPSSTADEDDLTLARADSSMAVELDAKFASLHARHLASINSEAKRWPTKVMADVLAELHNSVERAKRQPDSETEIANLGGSALFQTTVDELLKRDLSRLSHNHLLRIFLLLDAVYADNPTCSRVQTVINGLMFAIRSSSTRFVVTLLAIFADRQHSELHAKLFALIIHNIQTRPLEATDASHLVSLLAESHCFDTEFNQALQMRLVESVSGMAVKEQIRVLKVMSEKKIRSMPLMFAISHMLIKAGSNVSPTDAAKSICYFSSLNFRNAPTMAHLCNVITSKTIAEMSTIYICQLLSSLSSLRIRHLPLLSSIINERCINKKPSHIAKSALASVVLTVGHLAFHEANPAFFQLARDQLRLAIDDSDSAKVRHIKTAQWISLVWSLTVVGQQSDALVQSVLDSDFLDDWLAISEKSNTFPPSRKSVIELMNINATRFDSEADDSTLPSVESIASKLEATLAKLKPVKVETSETMAVDALLSALNSLAMSPTFSTHNVRSPMGFLIHGQCCFNINDGSMQPVAESDVQDNIKMAIVFKSYKDSLLLNEPLVDARIDSRPQSVLETGSAVIRRRLLESRGFTVVEIGLNDIDASDPAGNVRMLDSKMRQMLNRVHR